MDHFPAFLRLQGKPVLLVGAGDVAARKLQSLVSAGASVTVISPDIVAAVQVFVSAGQVRYVRRRFRPSDLDGQWLVVSATGVANTERAVAAAAAKRRIFCNAVDDNENCSYITPAIVDRSPLLIAVSSGGTAPVLARQIRYKIETMLPARLGDVANYAARWRKRVVRALGGFGRRLRFWETVFDGRVERALLAGREDVADRTMSDLLARAQNDTATTGHAWLVGAGPGDPELLTLKALQAMQQADIILHDRLVSDEVLALARRDAKRISVGKTPGCRANSQEEINALLVRLVAEGKRVCRLKGGDPFIFGRGGEEAEALTSAGLSCSIVPGITAAAGCAAAAGIPLTHRDHAQSLLLLTGHGKESIDTLDWPSLARDRQTLAVYMGVRRFSILTRNLTKHGRSTRTPVAIIENGTSKAQRVIRGTLGQLPMLARAHAIQSPAILIIGEVAALGVSSNGASAWPESTLANLSRSETAMETTAESAIKRA